MTFYQWALMGAVSTVYLAIGIIVIIAHHRTNTQCEEILQSMTKPIVLPNEYHTEGVTIIILGALSGILEVMLSLS